jgi:glutaminyl-peptide cyclotransferase
MRLIGIFVCFLWLSTTTLAQSSNNELPTRLIPEVINVYPHDGFAFTQGLLYHDGLLYESTGLRGESSLRQVEIGTGEVLRLVDVSRPESELTAANPLPDYFAEGLVLHNNQLIQLTWTEEQAFVYDLETFEQQTIIPYEGEGWGICTDGSYFYMSDSTSSLDLRDLETFDLIVSFAVTYNTTSQDGSIVPVVLSPQLLNELECVGDYVYANLWQTDFIAQIDKRSGQIIALIDCSALLTAEERAAALARGGGATLNGIAYNPDTDTFYITGKLWDKLFEVRFISGNES